MLDRELAIDVGCEVKHGVHEQVVARSLTDDPEIVDGCCAELTVLERARFVELRDAGPLVSVAVFPASSADALSN